jgi:tetratricopeptide (TPR) repeat protein
MLLSCRITAAPIDLGWARWLGALCLAIWLASPVNAAGESVTNAPVPVPPVNSAPATNLTATPAATPATSLATTETNTAVPGNVTLVETFNTQLAAARYFEKTSQPEKAEPILISLLAETVPDSICQAAFFDLGEVVRQENDLPRAVAVNAQFLERWPYDPRVPEVLLRQGRLYRQMGLNNLALTKFYAVMTAALSLKSDRPDYYPALVLEAQTEIADTHYLMGRYSEAAEFYLRLIKQGNPALNRQQAQFRLIRSLAAVGHNEDASSQARDYLTRYPDAPEQPEVRFYLAQTLKQMDRNNEAQQQVLLLLQEEKAKTRGRPEVWAYWQQRAGNEVANQLYREGDYIRALDIYINLAQLDSAPAWQLPVQYQIGLTYERLAQPQKAIETYNEILKHESVLSTNATPGQKAVFGMARWRAGFLGWQSQAENANQTVAYLPPPAGQLPTNTPAAPLP